MSVSGILFSASGNNPVALPGYISLQDTDIDFTNNTIMSADATRFDGAGMENGNGSWEGVFTGPNGEELAGVIFVDNDTVREVGVMIANR